MKNLFLLAVAFIAVTAFAGCSNDDALEINPKLIVGKWQLVRSVGYYFDFDDGGVRVEFDDDTTSENRIVIFNANGTAVLSQNGDESKFYYKIEGNIYYGRESTTESWENDSDHPSVRTIRKLTNTELVINDFREFTEGGGIQCGNSSTSYYVRK